MQENRKTNARKQEDECKKTGRQMPENRKIIARNSIDPTVSYMLILRHAHVYVL